MQDRTDKDFSTKMTQMWHKPTLNTAAVSSPLSACEWDSVWSRLKASLGKEQREPAGSAATPTRPRSPFSLCHPENFRKLCSLHFTRVKFLPQRGGSKVPLWGPHTSTMTSAPLFFPLHSNARCCSHNGWHRHSSGDFGEKITETFSCEADVMLSRWIQTAPTYRLLSVFRCRNKPSRTVTY